MTLDLNHTYTLHNNQNVTKQHNLVMLHFIVSLKGKDNLHYRTTDDPRHVSRSVKRNMLTKTWYNTMDKYVRNLRFSLLGHKCFMCLTVVESAKTYLELFPYCIFHAWHVIHQSLVTIQPYMDYDFSTIITTPSIIQGIILIHSALDNILFHDFYLSNITSPTC